MVAKVLKIKKIQDFNQLIRNEIRVVSIKIKRLQLSFFLLFVYKKKRKRRKV